MKQAQPRYLNRLLHFWIEADAVLAERGLPPLEYAEARDLFDLEIAPDDVPHVLSRVEQKSPLEASPLAANQLSRGQE